MLRDRETDRRSRHTVPHRPPSKSSLNLTHAGEHISYVAASGAEAEPPALLALFASRRVALRAFARGSQVVMRLHKAVGEASIGAER